MVRWSAVAVVLLLAFTLGACEKPDASFVTSPTVKTLIGTTTGNVAFNAPEAPPAPKDPPQKWQVDFDLARWATLENGDPSLELIAQVATRAGAGMEIWVLDGERVVARWSAGSTANYVGTVCFQLRLEIDGEAVPVGSGKHTAVLAFRDPGSGVVAARRIDITNTTPKLEGTAPSQGSEVFREALACRRGQ